MAQDYKVKNKSTSKFPSIVLAFPSIVLVVLVLCLVGIATLNSGNSTKQSNQSKPADQKTKQDRPKDKKVIQDEPKEISRSDAEGVCQDANFLQSYIDLRSTSIVTLGYSPYFSELEGTAKVLIWNGKDKDSNKPISFICDVDYKDSKVQVTSLAIDGRGVMGTALDQDLQEVQ